MIEITNYIFEKFKISKDIDKEKLYLLIVPDTHTEIPEKYLLHRGYISSFSSDRLYDAYIFSIYDLQKEYKKSIQQNYNITRLKKELRDKLNDIKSGKLKFTKYADLVDNDNKPKKIETLLSEGD